jgi:hypothetical protein
MRWIFLRSGGLPVFPLSFPIPNKELGKLSKATLTELRMCRPDGRL